MPQFKQMPCDPKQMWLVAPSLDEMVGLDSDVRALSEAMDRLDWSAMEGTYSETGCPAYPPCVMTKLLVYAYSKGVRSSRKIEELVEHDVRYMWLGGQLKPDFRTIARFRKEKFNEVSELFADSVRLCKEAGLVSMQVVAIDGTKVAANAGKKSVYDAKRLEREREAVERVLREAEEVDASEDAQYGDSNGREIPEHLRDAQKRKEKLDEIAQRLSGAQDRVNIGHGMPDDEDHGGDTTGVQCASRSGCGEPGGGGGKRDNGGARSRPTDEGAG